MPTVLLVDDEPMVLRVLRKELAGQPYDFIYAEGGAQALAVIAERNVDVIVTDQRMTEVTGIELLEAARERNPDTVGILMIYQRDRDIGRIATSRGLAQRCLLKPWEFRETRYAVACALETYRLRTENQRLRYDDVAEDGESSASAAEVLGSILEIRRVFDVLARDLQNGTPNLAELNSVHRTIRAMQQVVGRLPEHAGDAACGAGPSCPLTARVNLRDLVDGLLDSLGGIAHQRDVVIETRFDSPRRLYVDADRTDPAVLLLLSHAIGNTREGTTVRLAISYDAPSADVHIAVTDEGPELRTDEPEGHSHPSSPIERVRRMLDEYGGRLETDRDGRGRNRYVVVVPASTAPGSPPASHRAPDRAQSDEPATHASDEYCSLL